MVYNISIVVLPLVLRTMVPKPQPAVLIEQRPEAGVREHEVHYTKKKNSKTNT